MKHLLHAHRPGAPATPPLPDPPPAVAPPPTGSSLYWQLSGSVPLDRPEDVYDVDGFATSAEDVALLKAAGKYTIAYFSAGTFEEWRPDASAFPPAVKGAALDEWPGERWLLTDQLSTLVPIMDARAAIAAAKGFHAIEWDNLDGYLNGTGVSEAVHKQYLQALADLTHAWGLAAVFKNTPELAGWAAARFDACLAEEAYRYNEIGAYDPWASANKALWAVEYQGTLNCADAASRGIYLAKYPLALDGAPSATCDGAPTGLLGAASAPASAYPATGFVTVGDWYVATSGDDGAPGTFASPLRTIAEAFSRASLGDIILVRAGTYFLSQALQPPAGVRLFAYGAERPTLDRGLNAITDEVNYGLRITSGGVHVKGFALTGVPERVNAPDSSFAVLVNAAGVTIEDLHVHGNRTGTVRFTTNANDCLALDVRIWNNRQLVTGTPTNTWDGIAGTHGNYASASIDNLSIVRCGVANAGDDGFDLWAARNSRIIDCVSVGAGYHPDGSSTPGDGGGFKMGGSTGGAGNNLLQGSLALGNRATGLKSNSTKGDANSYVNNTLVRNAHGIIADTDTNAPYLTHNIALNNATYNTSILATRRTRNTFDLGIANAGFASDYSLAVGSACIGTGTDGANLGASSAALLIAKELLALPTVFAGRP